jgi:SagB-type dehydrogenase family enzyme
MESDRGEAARRFHDATKHSYESVRHVPHFLDWDNRPLPFKLYRDLRQVPLPDVSEAGEVSALAALSSTTSPRISKSALELEALARILFYTAGVTKKRAFPGGGEMLFRAAACTGALYHIEIYLVSGSVEGLDAGVYHYEPKSGSLEVLRDGDWRESLVEASGGDPRLRQAEAAIVLTSTYWRNAWKYQTRAYRHTFWDSGTMLANLLAMTSALELPAHLALGFADDDVNRLVDVDSDKEASVAIVSLGGGPSEIPPAPGAVEPLGFETAPLSRVEVDYPLIRETHRASSLQDSERAHVWRRQGAAPPRQRAENARPADDQAAPIESVIRRRGSSRRFERAPISYDALSTILATASHGVDGDVFDSGATLTDLYVVANDVDGLEQGTYFYEPEDNALTLLKKGSFRSEARYLDLEQDLAGDASANIYVLVSLEPLLERLGERGYRVAQLEGGIVGGRVYLASYALGLGASGLTFFDDAVTEFFSPHAAGKAVMFLAAVGVPGKRTASSGP